MRTNITIVLQQTSDVSKRRIAVVRSPRALGTRSGCMCRAPWNPTCAMDGFDGSVMLRPDFRRLSVGGVAADVIDAH